MVILSLNQRKIIMHCKTLLCGLYDDNNDDNNEIECTLSYYRSNLIHAELSSCYICVGSKTAMVWKSLDKMQCKLAKDFRFTPFINMHQNKSRVFCSHEVHPPPWNNSNLI